ISIPSNSKITLKDVEKVLEKFDSLKKVKKIGVTGFVSSRLPKKILGIRVNKVNEIHAIGLGAKIVSGQKNFLAVSCGSGTACVSVRGKKFSHIGGTAVGGKTLQGLCKLLLGTSDLEKISKLAEKGNLKKVDLTLEEIYPTGLGLLPKEATASHFGSLKNFSKNDLALGIVNLTAQVVGTTAVFASRAEKKKLIVFTGKLVSFEPFKKILLKRIFWLGKTKFLIPKQAGIATAIGSALYK
ncbi:MAG: hypothetical protein Q7K42_02200, partial [Candidatus Diapherotrites archaeon]|nr:hypothetical protein [Candidatus Diapherotrites archaeon]